MSKKIDELNQMQMAVRLQVARGRYRKERREILTQLLERGPLTFAEFDNPFPTTFLLEKTLRIFGSLGAMVVTFPDGIMRPGRYQIPASQVEAMREVLASCRKFREPRTTKSASFRIEQAKTRHRADVQSARQEPRSGATHA